MAERLLEIYRDASGVFSGRLVGADPKILLGPGNVATLTLTIFDKTSKEIVNERDKYALLSGGNWAPEVSLTAEPDANGHNLHLHLTPEDHVFVNADTTNRAETHVVLIEGTTSGIPTYKFRQEFEYAVKKSQIDP